ncbi:MAG: hypothetical protein A2939_04805 [Parcubacteria group bacterium RIFCSPLOWO2_01_FULL_48_18]|nr:MAG: hypothetical protein A2939_04805 [Parcubacteria group bacterium RIFCSPLOWO2_01_FULL_48_18]
MLILTLPQVHQKDLLKDMIAHPLVKAVRYNTGTNSAYSPRETLRRISTLAQPFKKPVYVDLKAKQLRVVEWANLPEGPIVLNHRITVTLPATVCFRGDDRSQLCEVVDGNQIYVDPLPKYPVGRGQAVNILAPDLKIEGGLLPADHDYIEAALAEGMSRFMLSFVENMDDVRELENAIGRYRKSRTKTPCEIVLKIESRAGIDFVAKTETSLLRPYRLMAARDDLMIQIGINAMPDALKIIIEKDRHAICASRLLMGLETGAISMADVSDLEYMKSLSYGIFMLSDSISRNHFRPAMDFWLSYTGGTP